MHLGSTKMIKKIALATTLLSSLAYADISEKGFFVGVDLSSVKYNSTYATKGGSTVTKGYDAKGSVPSVSWKAGYQYYFTRIYARLSNNRIYKDNKKNYYEMNNQVFELNTDYSPVLYKGNNRAWNIRAVAGVGVGANKSSLGNYKAFNLDSSPAIMTKNTQWEMEYGYQLGLLSEFDFGLSAEIGYRYRSGLMAEFTNATKTTSATDEMTFLLVSKEIYFGLNYLF